MKFLFVIGGLVGSVGLWLFALLTKPQIFDSSLSNEVFPSIFYITYGELVQCMWIETVVAVLFLIFGILMIVYKDRVIE